MQVLIVGNGGREHALACCVAKSPKVTQIFVAPGNAGTLMLPNCDNIDIAATAIDDLLQFAKTQAIDLCIVGPEAPLALGIVDRFTAAGIACFGPSQLAARLESSKSFSKAFMQAHNIPTAAYAEFADIQVAEAYIDQCTLPIVIKADGLAAGKGVVIAEDVASAKQAINDMLGLKKYGDAGGKLIIEQFLNGEEASFIVMTDGEHVLPLASSQDHKRLLDGDQGPNTGGMGAYSPAPIVDNELEQQVLAQIIYPTIRAMAASGQVYRGFLYAGLMIDSQGQAHVLEFNCRLGDPETQVLLPRLQSDITDLCLACINGELAQQSANWDPRPALGVVVATKGYPEAYAKHLPLPASLQQALPADLHIFHAGTACHEQHLVSNGGRVLCVTALADDLASAQQHVYQWLDQQNLDGFVYRHDIGYRAIKN